MAAVVQTQAGNISRTVLSGTAGGASLLQSGPGVLQSIIPHASLLSGQAVTFYDGVAAISGAPLATSGHIILGGITAGPPAGLSGTYTPANTPIVVNMPFFSGLGVSSISGGTGFTVNIVAGKITV